MSDPFERVETRNTHASKPTLRISPDRPSGYLSVGAVREFFDGVDRVAFYVDRDTSRIAIVEDEGESSYSLSSKSGGANVAVMQPLREIGVEQDDLDEAHVCPMEEDDETGYAVVDVKEVVEAATDDTHCPECGERYSEHGIGAHLKTHDEVDNPQKLLKEIDPDEIGEPVPDGDDSWREQYKKGGSEA